MNDLAELARSIGSAFTNTLGATMETRKIVLAQGVQFNNTDLAFWPYMVMPDGLMTPTASRTLDWPKSMRKRAPLAIVKTAGGFEYTSVAQGVKFEVKLVNTKDEFRKALLTKDVHVIYGGHARYGRGPCFGVLATPGVIVPSEDWENGTSPATTGLFRMGYPFIGVPAAEIIEHGYTANLVESTMKVTSADSEADLKPHVGSLKAKTAADIHPDLPKHAKDKTPTKTWWTYKAFEGGKLTPHVVLHAHWTGTVSAPADLGATTPECRVFCHFACDTFKHNHKILRDAAFKGWKRAGDDRFAYFTTAIANNLHVGYWLYHLFTYPKPNAFGDWEPSITYTVGKVNADLAADGESYRII